MIKWLKKHRIHTRKISKRRLASRKKSARKLRGGANANHWLVFYTYFFGNDSSIANIIPAAPSTVYDCYYFSNNKNTLEKLKGTAWKPVYIDKGIKNTNVGNTMDGKEIKACPHHFEQLKGYTYSCFFDSKLTVVDTDVEKMIRDKLETGPAVMIMNTHKFVKPGIWEEYNESMKHDRYRAEEKQYSEYINEQVTNGLKTNVDTHFAGGFIIRKSGSQSEKINEEWYKHIMMAGIQDQISFFFVQQQFKGLIVSTDTWYGS